jgi:hypothetical protein
LLTVHQKYKWNTGTKKREKLYKEWDIQKERKREREAEIKWQINKTTHDQTEKKI